LHSLPAMFPSPSHHGDMNMNVDIVLEQGSVSTPAHSWNKPAVLPVSATAIDTSFPQSRTGSISPSNRQQSPTKTRSITPNAGEEGGQLGLTSHQGTTTLSESQRIIHDTPAPGQKSSSGTHIPSRSSKRKTSIVIEIPPWTGSKRRVIPLEGNFVKSFRLIVDIPYEGR